MKGLVIKDCLVLWNNNKFLFIAILVCTIFASFSDSTVFSFIAFSVTATLPLTIMAYDEQSKWEQYAITMPYSRKDFVLSKYILMITSLLALTLINILLGAISTAIQGNFVNMKEYCEAQLFFMSFAIIIPSITLPISMKLGIEKGRLFSMIIVGLIVGVGSAFLSSDALIFLNNFNIAFLLIVVLIILLVSTFLSVKLYEKREL